VRGALLAALLLLAPLALAAQPARVDVSSADPPVLAGALSLQMAQGFLDPVPGLAGGGALRASWSAAHGYLLTKSAERYTPLRVHLGTTTPRNDTVDLAAGNLTGLACAEHCVVALFWSGGDALLNSSWDSQGAPIARLGATRVVAAGNPEGAIVGAAPEGFRQEIPASWVGASMAARVEGRATLLVYNATARVATSQGEQTFATGEADEPDSAVGTRHEDRILVLDLEGARVDAPPGSLAYAPSAGFSLVGSLHVERAEGRAEEGGFSRPVHDAALDATGRFQGTLSGAPDAGLGLAPRPGGIRLSFSGDADSLAIAGSQVAPSRAPTTRETVGGIAAVGILVALAALYSRISDAAVLHNANRRRLLAALQAEPGASVGDLSRKAGLSEGVARYHLRILATRGLARLERAGRLTLVYPGRPDGARTATDRTLRGARRLDVAQRLVEAPQGLTQQDLAALTGLSQRLVSYHLGALRDAGLVEASGHPLRYAPTPELLDNAGRRTL